MRIEGANKFARRLEHLRAQRGGDTRRRDLLSWADQRDDPGVFHFDRQCRGIGYAIGINVVADPDPRSVRSCPTRGVPLARAAMPAHPVIAAIVDRTIEYGLAAKKVSVLAGLPHTTLAGWRNLRLDAPIGPHLSAVEATCKVLGLELVLYPTNHKEDA